MILLVTGCIAAALVAISLWPPKWPASWAFAMWFPAWLVSELPVHALVVEIAVVAVAIAAGGVHGAAAWIGLGLAAAAALGLLGHVRDALRSAAVLGVQVRWRPLAYALIFPFHPAAVERVCDVAYHGRLCLDIYKTAHLRPDAPVFLYVHGGAWVIGHKAQQGRLLAHRLALAGWLVVSIDYRLSPGATFPDHLHDVKRAIAWVREHAREHGGDPSRLIIGGASAGAHLSALAALTPNAVEYQRDFPDVDTTVQGCVCFYGVYDLVDFPNRGFGRFVERVVMKRSRADAVAEFEKASPRHRVGEHAPPFLILHGSRDSLAPLAGAHRFRDALRAVSRAPVEWYELPGGNHAFDLFPSLRADAAVIGVERFCEKIVALSTVNMPRRDDRARTPTKP